MVRKWTPRGRDRNFTAWYLQTSLRLWVGLHGQLISMAVSGELAARRNFPYTSSVFDRYHVLACYSGTTRGTPRFDATQLFAGIRQATQLEKCFIGKLTSEDGHETLSWATEHLSLNIAAYCSPQLDDAIGGPWSLARSHWAETDGGLEMIEHMVQHQNDATAGIPDEYYIWNPVRPFRLFTMEDATDWMLNVHLNALVDEFVHADEISNLAERKQLAYLCLALSPATEIEVLDNYYIRNLEEWSAGLLRRYISAAGLLKGSQLADLQKTSLVTLRLITHKVLHALEINVVGSVLRLAPKMPTRKTPSRLHRDLFERLAWNHGRLLKLAWCTLLRTGKLRLFALARNADDARGVQVDDPDSGLAPEGRDVNPIDDDDGPVVEI